MPTLREIMRKKREEERKAISFYECVLKPKIREVVANGRKGEK